MTSLIDTPLLVLFRDNSVELETEIHLPEHWALTAYVVAICDLVKEIAEELQIANEEVWNGLNEERKNPTSRVNPDELFYDTWRTLSAPDAPNPGEIHMAESFGKRFIDFVRQYAEDHPNEMWSLRASEFLQMLERLEELGAPEFGDRLVLD